MAIFLEGPCTFEIKGGIVRAQDATGQLLCCSLGDFRTAMLLAQEAWSKWQVAQLEQQDASVVTIRRN